MDGGADVDMTDNNGLTPLCYAAKLGHTDCITALFERGANVLHTDLYKLTPLEHAEDCPSAEALTLIKNLVQKVEARDKRSKVRLPGV